MVHHKVKIITHCVHTNSLASWFLDVDQGEALLEKALDGLPVCGSDASLQAEGILDPGAAAVLCNLNAKRVQLRESIKDTR
jgi:hypothetical protein